MLKLRDGAVHDVALERMERHGGRRTVVPSDAEAWYRR